MKTKQQIAKASKWYNAPVDHFSVSHHHLMTHLHVAWLFH